MNLVNQDMSKCIVILEDEKATLEMMEIALEDEGYDVVAINHHEPPEYILDFAPQLILLDVRLSNGYGHLLCEDLKKNPSTSKIPVILVSGAGNLEKIAKDCKANSYLSKPFNMDELLTITRKYL
jgi:DNA-binding response OmpR family regulator